MIRLFPCKRVVSEAMLPRIADMNMRRFLTVPAKRNGNNLATEVVELRQPHELRQIPSTTFGGKTCRFATPSWLPPYSPPSSQAATSATKPRPHRPPLRRQHRLPLRLQRRRLRPRPIRAPRPPRLHLRQRRRPIRRPRLLRRRPVTPPVARRSPKRSSAPASVTAQLFKRTAKAAQQHRSGNSIACAATGNRRGVFHGSSERRRGEYDRVARCGEAAARRNVRLTRPENLSELFFGGPTPTGG